ncbi:hypothetical protein J2S36_001506 [Arcanobacterium hippocoleae]|uniref:Uncharacterized protein n=1 Tax=Arcanobacterium hippocoleae TaxID=149017 RepID=A0ABU1T3K3_9ACTO|nr:hypothetical protein [Arcanobacterium hippocoleae]MDR6939963.1 hypothetical protein [Arcanobacterium hippocoleae]
MGKISNAKIPNSFVKQNKIEKSKKWGTNFAPHFGITPQLKRLDAYRGLRHPFSGYDAYLHALTFLFSFVLQSAQEYVR